MCMYMYMYIGEYICIYIKIETHTRMDLPLLEGQTHKGMPLFIRCIYVYICICI